MSPYEYKECWSFEVPGVGWFEISTRDGSYWDVTQIEESGDCWQGGLYQPDDGKWRIEALIEHEKRVAKDPKAPFWGGCNFIQLEEVQRIQAFFDEHGLPTRPEA
jgi:hypothetical protein